jgi:hypothetical protein
MITFKLEDEERKVELSTNNEWITLEELFRLWVDFAAGCGFTIDKVEIESMWAGVEDTEKFTKAIEALEGVKEFVDDLYPHTEQGTVLVPRLAKALETLEELKKGQDDA